MPKLRFPGFEGEWENTELRNLAVYGKDKTKVAKNHFVSTENIEQNFGGIIPFEDSETMVDGTEFSKGDILIANIRPYLKKIWQSDMDGACNADVLVLKPQEIDNVFFYFLVAQNKFIDYVMGGVKGSKMPRGDKTHILQYNTAVPSILEQRQIAKFLSLLSNRIAAQKELVETLKKYKRGVFEAIFSQRLRLVPKEEQKSWKAFKLSDFATRITRKNSGVTDIPLTISAQYGLIDQRDFFSKVVASTDMGGYYLLHNGEYAYNRSTSNDYPFGSIKRLELYDKGAVSTLYLCFSINENVVMNDLVRWYFESSQWHQGINEICAEGARNHGLLNVPTDGFFSTIHILPSDTEEQARIAMFLSRIHYKLVQAQKELEKLICLRNGLLQQLFI